MTLGSDVYFTGLRTRSGDGLLSKLKRLAYAAGIGRIEMNRRFVAIKVHFGEPGNLSYLRANYAKVIADIVREKGGIPFLTDCSTLYVGRRKNAAEHLEAAYENGYNPFTTGCHVLIGDGLKGDDDVDIPIDGMRLKTAKIGRTIADADIIITMTHFKCHELTGFGGTIKNLGMGCASRRGKMELHSAGRPSLDADKCNGCGGCAESCAHSAITVSEKANIDDSKCVGCGRCIPACAFDAIYAEFDNSIRDVCELTSEYAYAS
ncbi:MAG: DUF362 domain-containing protein, partial [Methanomassiliicoccaceae archaeon]|nr:DUF362 domain-containing protein [Methanomassiliicoccaceae archaeon]